TCDRAPNIADCQIEAGPIVEAVSGAHDRAGATLRAASDAGATVGPEITPQAGQPDADLALAEITAARIGRDRPIDRQRLARQIRGGIGMDLAANLRLDAPERAGVNGRL